MIDWFTARVPLTWEEPINDGRFVSVNQDGTVEYEVDKTRAVPSGQYVTARYNKAGKCIGSFSDTMTIRSEDLGFVKISGGSPAKWLQGHNLVGSDDLHGLVIAVLDRMCLLLDIHPTPEDRAAWLRGDIELSRVDCNLMWELGTEVDVLEWLRATSHLASVKYRGRGHYQEGTLTFGYVNKGKRAMDWQLTMYAKGPELRRPGHHLPLNLPMREELMTWAENKLRIEVRLRTRELRRFGLHTVGGWSPLQCSQVVERYLAKVDMSEQQMVHIDIEAGLKPRHRLALATWKTGADMKAIMPKQTFYRVRREIIEAVEIDIASRANVSNVVPLRRVLEARPAHVPDWVQATVFVPPPRLRAVA